MIRLAVPNITESDILRVADALPSGSLVQGEEVRRFEQALSFYQTKYALGPEDHPVAARLYSHGLALPLHGRMDQGDVHQVAEALRDVLVC